MHKLSVYLYVVCLSMSFIVGAMNDTSQDSVPTLAQHITSLEELLTPHDSHAATKSKRHDPLESSEKIASLLSEAQKIVERKKHKLGNYLQKIKSFERQYSELFGDDDSEFLSAKPSHFNQKPLGQDSPPATPPTTQSSAAEITSWDTFLKEVTRLEHPLIATFLSIIFYVVQNDKLIDRITSWGKPRDQQKPSSCAVPCPSTAPTSCCSCGQPLNRPDTHSHSLEQLSSAHNNLNENSSCISEPQNACDTSSCAPRQEITPLGTNQGNTHQPHSTFFSRRYLCKLMSDSLCANAFQTILPHFITSLRVQNGWKYMGTYIGVDIAGNLAATITHKKSDPAAMKATQSGHQPIEWHYFFQTAFKAAVAYCISCAV